MVHKRFARVTLSEVLGKAHKTKNPAAQQTGFFVIGQAHASSPRMCHSRSGISQTGRARKTSAPAAVVSGGKGEQQPERTYTCYAYSIATQQLRSQKSKEPGAVDPGSLDQTYLDCSRLDL
jgi:hypothetical protein